MTEAGVSHPLGDLKMMRNGGAEETSTGLPEAAPEMVHVEVLPVGPGGEQCDGAVVRLVQGEGTPGETALMAALSPTQCREIARRLLIIADAASRDTERTVLAVTSTGMWKLPGQRLIVSYNPDPHFQFVVQAPGPRNVVRPQRRLLVPGRA